MVCVVFGMLCVWCVCEVLMCVIVCVMVLMFEVWVGVMLMCVGC